MEKKDFDLLVEQVGTEAAKEIRKEAENFREKFTVQLEGYKNGTISVEKFEEAQREIKAAYEKVENIAIKQGTTIQELSLKLDQKEIGTKTIAEQLSEDKEELRQIFKNRTGAKEYMLSVNDKNQFVMKPFDTTKAASIHATIANAAGGGGTSSIAQNIDATTLLRMGRGAPIMAQFRNNPWIFDLVNLVNVGFDNPFFMWYDEQTRQGASATVIEAGTKPLVQYAYTLQSSSYKKEAVLVSMTQEFSLDFQQLQSEILSKAQIDLVNRINTAILPNITSAATAYNLGVTYAPVGDKITAANDWDVIAAMSAQVENSTFASQTNTAVVSTVRKYRMGTMKDSTNNWLNNPAVLNNINIVSNPGQTASNVMVGDFKQYNVALRGGMIVKVGYNGTDFAQNMFSTVIEQFYFDYISAARTAAIVKGPDFATVKTALT